MSSDKVHRLNYVCPVGLQFKDYETYIRAIKMLKASVPDHEWLYPPRYYGYAIVLDRSDIKYIQSLDCQEIDISDYSPGYHCVNIV